ncbi:MAG TPA: ABC transporter ATP-binding protein [Solirubrobacteraceae bacterium]|jgi:branched-chain amino acid transport system ATP-binding protein
MAELIVTQLQASYGSVQALRGVDLRVGSGECAALLGANGSGKTTVMRSISGLVRHTGSITLDGKPLAGDPGKIARSGIGHVLEGRHVFTGLTVRENLELGRYGAGKRSPSELTAVVDAFPVLKQKIRRLGSQLSGGEQQQVAIARTLMARPTVLLLDEPSLGLSPVVIDQVAEAMTRIRAEWNTTMLLAEQSTSLVLALATHFYVLQRGTVSYSGTEGSQVLWQEVHRAYLGADPAA